MMTADQGSQAEASLWLPPLGRLCVLEKFADGSPTPTSFELLVRQGKDPHSYLAVAEALASADSPNGYVVRRIGYSRHKPNLRVTHVGTGERARWRYVTDQDLSLVARQLFDGLDPFRAWLEREMQGGHMLQPEECLRFAAIVEQANESLWAYSYRNLVGAPKDLFAEPPPSTELLLYVRDFGESRGLTAELCALKNADGNSWVLRVWLTLTLSFLETSRPIDVSHLGDNHHAYFRNGRGTEPDQEGVRYMLRCASMDDLLVLNRCAAYRLAQRSPEPASVNVRLALEAQGPCVPSDVERARLARVLDLYFPEPTPEGAA